MRRRAYLVNGLVYVPDILVKYRINSGGVSDAGIRDQGKYMENIINQLQDQIVRFNQLRIDVRYIDAKEELLILKKINEQEAVTVRYQKIFTSNLIKSSLAVILEIIKGPKNFIYIKDLLRMFIIRWVPKLIGFKPKKLP